MSPLPKINGKTRYVLVIKNKALAKLQAYAARTHQPAEVVVEQLVERLPETGTLPPVVKTVGLLLLCSLASAVSVHEIMAPVPVGGWVAYDQDAFAFQEDDKYTGGLRIGASLGEWTATASYAIHTDKKDGRTRCDEVTATLQRRLGDITLGAGVVVSGNLLGDAVQEEVHRWGSDLQYDLAYEDGTWRPLVVATWDVLLLDGMEAREIEPRHSVIRWRTGAVWAWDALQVTSGPFLAAGTVYDRRYAYAQPVVILTVGSALSDAAGLSWPKHLITPGLSLGIVGTYLNAGVVITLEHAYGHAGIVF